VSIQKKKNLSTNCCFKGDLCGAIYVDRAFLGHVKTHRQHMNKLDSETERRFMEKEWENNVKRNFDGTPGPWTVELPHTQQTKRVAWKSLVGKKEKSNILQLQGYLSLHPYNSIRNSNIQMLIDDREYVEQIFNEVVQKILDLLRDQVQGIRDQTGASPKVILQFQIYFLVEY
jgi:hypothetical protein